MKKLLLLLILSTTSFVSAQITELTYNTVSNTLNVDQIPYELFGEGDLLWGDVVRRHNSTRAITPRDIIQDGRTFTTILDQYQLQPEQYTVHYAKDGEWGIRDGATYGIETMEMPELRAEFTVPSAGVWFIWYTARTIDGQYTQTGASEFTVE